MSDAIFLTFPCLRMHRRFSRQCLRTVWSRKRMCKRENCECQSLFFRSMNLESLGLRPQGDDLLLSASSWLWNKVQPTDHNAKGSFLFDPWNHHGVYPQMKGIYHLAQFISQDLSCFLSVSFSHAFILCSPVGRCTFSWLPHLLLALILVFPDPRPWERTV